MGRPIRFAPGNLVYHAMSRSVDGRPLFESGGDYAAFERVLERAVKRYSMRLLEFAVLPAGWNLLVFPRRDRDLVRFVGWMKGTQAQQWNRFRARNGPVYSDRYRAFPVQEDEHLTTVARYVVQGPAREGLIESTDVWRWSSRYRFDHGDKESRALLADWPYGRPNDWVKQAARPLTAEELEAIQRCVDHSLPFGSLEWTERMICRAAIESVGRVVARISPE